LKDSLLKIIFFGPQCQSVLKENKKNVDENEKEGNIYYNKNPAVFFTSSSPKTFLNPLYIKATISAPAAKNPATAETLINIKKPGGSSEFCIYGYLAKRFKTNSPCSRRFIFPKRKVKIYKNKRRGTTENKTKSHHKDFDFGPNTLSKAL